MPGRYGLWLPRLKSQDSQSGHSQESLIVGHTLSSGARRPQVYENTTYEIESNARYAATRTLLVSWTILWSVESSGHTPAHSEIARSAASSGEKSESGKRESRPPAPSLLPSAHGPVSRDPCA